MTNWDQPQGYKPDGLGMTEDELQEQIKLLPVKIANAEEGRANPNHDAKGKFSSGGHGSGQWTPTKGKLATVWQNGDHKVTNLKESSMSDSEVESSVIPRLNHLMDTNPTEGNVDLRIVNSLHMTDGRNLAGIGIIGTGQIKLSSEVTAGKKADIWFKDASGMKERAQAYKESDNITAAEVTLVHEWGHAIDRRDYKKVQKEAPKSISKYGQTDAIESYAENFSEFYFSKGKTDSKLVQDQAKEFGWKS